MCKKYKIIDNIILETRDNYESRKNWKVYCSKKKIKKLTQEQLAEKLGVSTNAVSKWERGLCLMDMSLLKPISKILDVTINEILSGEEINKEDIISKTDENIVNLTELYDLKSSKIGVDVFTIVTLILLIYYGKKDMNCLGFAMIWFVYRMTYSYNKYKYTRDKKEIRASVFYCIFFILTTIVFLNKHFN